MTEAELFFNVFIAMPLGVVLGLWLVYLHFGDKPFLKFHEGRAERLADYQKRKIEREWSRAARR